MIKAIRTALSAVAKKGVEVLQAGARSTQSHTMNYASVNTLDPSRLARAFSSADTGCITEQAELFHLIEEQDPHIYAELAKRRRAVTGLGWQLDPPDNANQSEINRVSELTDMLRNIPRFEDAQYDITDAVGKGFSALEIEWGTGSTWLPKALHWVPQHMFQVDNLTGKLQLLKMGIPEPLREFGWIVHEHRAKSGYIEQAALFRVLAWTYAYKAYNVRDMQRFLEVYGLPLRLGKYPAGITENQRNELLRAVRNIGNDGAGIVPSNMSIDFIQAMKTGSVDDFLSSVAYWERKQSMAILGGTLTSQADGKTSTNALGEVHDRVRREIMLHDVRQIAPTINDQLLRPIIAINGMFKADRLPKFNYQTEETVDQGKMVDVLTKAVSLGLEIDLDWAHKTMQIPRAAQGTNVLGGKAHTAKLKRLAAALANESDPTLRYTNQLSELCARHEETLIQQIAAIVAEAGDFDAALSAIESMTRNTDGWANDLAMGTAAAHLAGRSDIGTGE